MPAKSKLQWMARSGYCARGLVFFIVGGLALFSGFSPSDSDTKSALDILLEQPFGRVWVSAIALGLMGFVAWRLAQSVGNADHHERDAKGTAIRAALFGSALAYIALAYYAFDHALGLGTQANGGGEKGLAAWTLSLPFGRYLVAAIGVGFIFGGIVTVAKGVLRKYERYLSSEAVRIRAITLASIYGLSARGVLFAVVGSFMVYAGFEVNPDEAGTMGEALTWIRNLPYGGALYVVTALGLVSFGVYNMIQARYRIVREPDVEPGIKDAVQGSAGALKRAVRS